MKKLLLAICLVVTFSCTKEKTEVPVYKKLSAVSAKKITDDKTFQTYLSSLSNFLKNKFDAPKIKELMKLKDLNVEQQNEFAIALGFNSSAEFMLYARQQGERVEYLRNTYKINSINSADLNTLVLNGMTIEASKVVLVENDEPGDPSGGEDCQRKFTGCMTLAAAQSAVSHLGCLVVDWATLGVSAYFCHGAVFLIQMAMFDSCAIDKKLCDKSATPILTEEPGDTIVAPIDTTGVPVPNPF